jgi:hypothetical protein
MAVVLDLPVQADSLEHLLGRGLKTGDVAMNFVICFSLPPPEVPYFDDCCGGIPS